MMQSMFVLANQYRDRERFERRMREGFQQWRWQLNERDENAALEEMLARYQMAGGQL